MVRMFVMTILILMDRLVCHMPGAKYRIANCQKVFPLIGFLQLGNPWHFARFDLGFIIE